MLDIEQVPRRDAAAPQVGEVSASWGVAAEAFNYSFDSWRTDVAADVLIWVIASRFGIGNHDEAAISFILNVLLKNSMR
ncbi:MAG: hypothetical protein ACOYOF_19685, partial [Verrucomicrobiaceae bacterium]